MSRMWRRIRMISPLLRDRTVAVVLFVIAEIEVATVGGDAPLPLLMLGAAGYSLPFAIRRVRPLLAVVLVVASVVLMAALLTDTTQYFVPFLVAMLTSYGAGAYLDGRPAYLGLAIMVCGVLTVTMLSPSQITGDYVFPTAFSAVAWLSGRAVRTRTRLTEELHEAALREQEAQELESRRVAADERRRIAREMHDVVAHSISVMVVQAGGARRILANDPERAEQAAARIRAAGTDALAEMHILLGVLESAPDGATPPTLDGLEQLVARTRAAGLPVSLEVTGERRRLSPGAELAVYRVVQEALTNAMKHAGSATTLVRFAWGEDVLDISVADRGDGGPSPQLAGAGHGLMGMRERLRVYGGEVRTGPRPEGGFEVAAQLPLERATAGVA